MAPSKTRTVKNKHAGSKLGTGGSKSGSKSQSSGVSKSRKPQAKPQAKQVHGRTTSLADILKKKKKKTYSEKELNLPKLNMVTPTGVVKPKGKKKGKVFVDEKESMATILAMVQAEREGQIESKMIKARQMEEIREARQLEAEKKEAEKKAVLEKTKESLRKKRKRDKPTNESNINDVTMTGTRATKAPKKRVSFA